MYIYTWECLNKSRDVIGYQVAKYDHEITTKTLEADAAHAMSLVENEQVVELGTLYLVL